ncbi:MAG: linear amide C-N hydrolase [Idiomarina sp.]|nr:linear amide C-N hydrolase [Idiomarina sp.]
MKVRYSSIAVACALFVGFATPADACTRAVYQGPEGLTITARSMDWKDDIPANLWVFPRGMQRHGAVGDSSLEWTSQYASVITSSFDFASTDGMNEAGLVANLLWLAESEYPDFDGSQTGLSVAAWVQYVLDSYATVEEAVRSLEDESFVVVSAEIPGTERFTTVHLSISDRQGDSAIFEYIDGRLVIHHSEAYRVMTNSPIFEQQIALNDYWRQIGGTTMLPGTNRAADRFVRASFYIDAIPQTSDPRIAVGSVFSVIRNASVPYGISSENEPNISSTRWRSVADQKNLKYYFETALTPNTFWVDLNQFDLSEGAEVKRLRVDDHQIYSGEASAYFESTPAFEFAGL